MLRIADIMTSRVVTIDMDDRLTVAKEIFDQASFNHLLVTEDGVLQGVLSERDLLRAISPNLDASPTQRDLDTLQKRVHQIMSREPIAVAPHIDIIRASELILQHNIGCLAVIENNVIVGIVTWKDLLRAAISKD